MPSVPVLVLPSLIVAPQIDHVAEFLFGFRIHLPISSVERFIDGVFDLQAGVHEIVASDPEHRGDLADFVGRRPGRVLVLKLPDVAFAGPAQFGQLFKRVALLFS